MSTMDDIYQDRFVNTLDKEESGWYISAFTRLTIKLDPAYINREKYLEQCITAELSNLSKKPNIKFVVSSKKCVDKNEIVSVLVCLGELHGGKKYIRIAYLVVADPAEYLTHGKRILEIINKKYPDLVMFAYVRQDNKYAIEMIKMIGGKITADFFDPNYKYIDGWNTYVCE